MRKLKLCITVLFAVMLCFSADAFRAPEKAKKPSSQQDRPVDFRENCTVAQRQIDQDVNNVRARLTTGGDVWWDRNNGSYIVPKVAADQEPVSSIYTGAVWLGGFDPGGNLKVACQTYGNSTNASDFWPGPINIQTGFTTKDTCDAWDRFWVVTADEINEHNFRYEQAVSGGDPYTEDQIPAGVKGWPAKGNPYFFEENGFFLPSADQGLAGFHDEDGDTNYEPLEGDFPVIEIRGCNGPDRDEQPPAPDQMIFWIYNDAGAPGNIHGETESVNKIQMEVQVQAFAYESNDELNDMTFQRYKLINRAVEDIDSTFFAMWVDPDLGCADDDYVGCDTARSLAIVYNSDELDGISGITCDGIPTYQNEVPILGVDYFRGPLDEFRNEIGMSSFTYYNRGGQQQPPGTEDPEGAQQYYHYLSGSWADGLPFEYGGDGYNEGTFPINYAFPSPPNEVSSTAWSCCNVDGNSGFAPPLDRRTIQASGPFLLKPTTINELIIGVVWVADEIYPCPSLSRLLFADELAQALFNNCFDLNEGPDAPDMDWIELDQEIIAVLTNDTSTFNTNNVAENYFEPDAFAPTDLGDTLTAYTFEGYLIYQLAGPSVSVRDRNDPEKVRIVAQVDIKNGINRIFNWQRLNEDDQPTFIDEAIWTPTLQVEGSDEEIRHTFRFTNDAFGTGETARLINHSDYYYVALAYGYNQYAEFDRLTGLGQRNPFIAGNGNIGDGVNEYYKVTPRPITDVKLNSSYGDSGPLTRLDGVGTGGNFLRIADESRERMFEAGEADKNLPQNEPSTFDGRINYLENAAPIDVQVYNPLEVRNGTYQLTFFDENMDNDELDSDVRWRLLDLNDPSFVFESTKDIGTFYEEVLADLGLSIGVRQVSDVGTLEDDDDNGATGLRFNYSDDTKPQWFQAIPDGGSPIINEGSVNVGYNNLSSSIYNFVPTAIGEWLVDFDPFQGLTNIGTGEFFPFLLSDYRPRDVPPGFYLTPMSLQSNAGFVNPPEVLRDNLPDLRNVDIVLTSDKDKWSRCVIVETRSPQYQTFALPNGQIATSEGDRPKFAARAALSVGKEDLDGDGLPDPDDSKTTNSSGEEIDSRGMGWFPGYAVDVETGERLNIFFGENSAYAEENGLLSSYTGTQLDNDGNPIVKPTGRDMMFNPTDQAYMDLFTDFPSNPINIFDWITGGQHFIYVDGTRYDECEELHKVLDPDRRDGPFEDAFKLRSTQWTALPMLLPGQSMLSYANGLIPNDMVIELRVDNPFQVDIGTNEYNGYPTYEFTIDGLAAEELNQAEVNEALDQIRAVPNPYYAYSRYEDNVNQNVVKITNLPAKCVVTIYSLDGKFIRQYNRDERNSTPKGSGIPSQQIIPNLEWDLQNNKGIRVSSGVYLIHVDATEMGLGERTIKWFGVNRSFDSSGL